MKMSASMVKPPRSLAVALVDIVVALGAVGVFKDRHNQGLETAL